MEQIKSRFLISLFIILSGCVHKSVHKIEDKPLKIPEQTELPKQETLPISSPVTETAPPNLITEFGSVVVSTPPVAIPKNTPKFGFIFSGGGAKAWAHIGVLKELQKLKWPIHSVAGFEWGAVVAAVYAEHLSVNEVEWEMSKLKNFEQMSNFAKAVFEKKNTVDLKIPFVCPSLNLNKQTYFLLNRGQLDQLIPYCLAHPPLSEPYLQSVAVLSDIPSLAQHLRSTGPTKIILINVLSQTTKRSFVKDYTSAENILWVESAALMAKKPSGVDEVIQINLDDYGIADLDKRRDIIAKGAELSYDQLKKLAAKFGL